MTSAVTDISIIIVSWNAKAHLVKCLESLSSATRGLNAEIIVIDNASTDGSQGAVERLFPNVKLIKEDVNLGFAKANNIGIKSSRGKYVCLINSDVELLDDCLLQLLACMDAQPGAAAAGPLVLNADLTIQPSCRRFPSLSSALLSALGLERVNYLSSGKVAEPEVISGCFIMARREAVNAVGLLDERFFFYAEDTDWCKRFHDSGWKLLWCQQARAIHYGGASTARAPIRYYIELYRANFTYWLKHNGKSSLPAYIAITGFHQLTRMLKGAAMTLFPSTRKLGTYSIRRSAACLKWLASGRKLP